MRGGKSGSRFPSGSAGTAPRPPRFRSVFVCLSVLVCAWLRRLRAQRAGDGAASAAPSALPPTCISAKRTPYCHFRFSHCFPFYFLHNKTAPYGAALKNVSYIKLFLLSRRQALRRQYHSARNCLPLSAVFRCNSSVLHL